MFDKLVEIICNYVDVQPADVHEESRFMEDLGFTSFDFTTMTWLSTLPNRRS